MDTTQILTRMIGALAIILGLILILFYLLKIMGRRFQRPESNLVEVICTRMILPKRYLMVVRVGSRHLLLGATDQEIRLLGKLDASEIQEGHEG